MRSPRSFIDALVASIHAGPADEEPFCHLVEFDRVFLDDRYAGRISAMPAAGDWHAT